MAEKKTTIVKLQISGGQATAAPPVGTALGPTGINIGDFVKQFNDQTKDRAGQTLPVVITIKEDRSFKFIVKKQPMSRLILKELGIEKGSGKNLVKKVGTLNQQQVENIAKEKMSELNASDLDAAKQIVAGTARSMGIEVKN